METWEIDGSAEAAAAERMRLAEVRSTELLDTERELEYDQVIRLAAEICATPVCAFTLVDETRQWIKASVGLDVRETSREHSFCSRAIGQRGLFVVEDTRLDPRFADNPMVVNEPAVRFYAGMPVPGPGGHLLGTLCVADMIPRQLTVSQEAALHILAAQLQSRVELRVQRRRLEQALAAQEGLLLALEGSNDRFQTFMNNGPFLSYIKDAEGRFVFYNRQMADKFGVGSEEWLGRRAQDIWPGEMGQTYAENDMEAMRSQSMFEVEEETRDERGVPTFWRSSKFAFCNEKGERLLGGFATDITAEVIRRRSLEQTNEALERFATVDGLTGLVNRRVLDEEMAREFALSQRHGLPFSIVMLDLDNFKRRNDLYGHAAGDAALQSVARVLQETVRTTDVAGRFGGEEMLLLLPRTDLQGAMQLAMRVRRNMAEMTLEHGAVTASFGVACLDADVRTVRGLIEMADVGLYEAKRRGKNCVVGHGAAGWVDGSCWGDETEVAVGEVLLGVS